MRLSLSPFLIALGGIATSLADEEIPVPLYPTSEDEKSAPVDAPTAPGCRGMKLKQKDALPYPFPPPLVGEEFEAGLGGQMNSAYHVADQAGARAATCNANGLAGGYGCSNVDLLSMLTVDELNVAITNGGSAELNDIWGWTDPTSKREFSIVGLTTGTAFVEITDPYNPRYLGALPTKTVSSNWRDMKVIDHYALIVSEASNHGMQVFDLERLLTASENTYFTQDAHYGGFGNAHNVFVNEDSGFAYAVGTNTCNGGLHMVDVNDPMNPTNAGCFSQDGYVHDVQCVMYSGPDTAYTGKEICFCSNEDTITIVDVTNKSNPQQLSRTSYAGDRYTHQGWLTEDQAYFIFNDELDELYGLTPKTRTHVMDVTDLTSASYAGYHDGRTAAIDHNLYVLGDYVYQANYRAGLNILKINDMGSASFDEAGYFDIFPNSDSSSFNAAWSNYPYHESGVVTVSGIEQGLFVLKFNQGQTAAPVPVTSTPTKAPVPITSTPTKAPVPITPSPTKAPSVATCGDGICHVEEGEGCGLCPADCSSPTHCSMVSHYGSSLVYSSSSYGIVFDVAVGIKDLYFSGLKIYPYATTSAKVYMKSGSYSTDSNLNNWTKVFEGSISTASNRQDLNFDTRFLGESLSTVAFYISFEAGGAFVYSRDGMSNDDVTVLVGNTMREQTGETLPSTSFANRAFYEGIRYDYGSSTTTPAPVTSSTSTPTATPIATPTKSPTSSPTSSPTKSPVASPTSSPTSSPTKAPFVSTLAPVGSPTSSCSCCEDLTSQADEMEKAVEAILAMMLNGSTNAPTSAPTPTPCADRTDQWAIGTRNRTWCSWVKKATTATGIEKRCRNFDLFDDCPVACGSCP